LAFNYACHIKGIVPLKCGHDLEELRDKSVLIRVCNWLKIRIVFAMELLASDPIRAAQKELADISELMASSGKMKTVRLIHDAEGKTVGAIVTERTN
jgi:hypothetical protein